MKAYSILLIIVFSLTTNIFSQVDYLPHHHHQCADAADAADAVYAVDVDGDVDVLSASQTDDKIAWYENLGVVGIEAISNEIPIEFKLGQKESVFMGGVELTLGMQKSEIIPNMEKYNFIEYPKDAQWHTIWDSRDKILMIGIIQFDVNNNLSNVTKFWPNFSKNNCPDALKTLFTLLTRYENDSGIKVITQEIFEPRFKAKIIEFYIGYRNIEIGLKDNGDIYINESLRNK